MTKKYCVLWIPTIFHKEITVLENSPKLLEDDICDDVGSSHHVSVAIIKNAKGQNDIFITSIPNGNLEKKSNLTLEYVDSSQNGMIQFSFDEEKDSECQFILEALQLPIYHLIKDFFHHHEYHDPECDSSLEAYIGDREIDLHSYDNEALIFYLRQYEEKFIGYKDLISEELDDIQESNKKGNPSVLNNIKNRYSIVEELCNNALGESVYYNALLHSWYNISCKHNVLDNHKENNGPCQHCFSNVCVELEKCKDLHRVALNTKNALDCISLLQSENRDLLNFYHSQITVLSWEDQKNLLTEIATLTKDNNSLVSDTKSLSSNNNFLVTQVKKSLRISDRIAWISLAVAGISFIIAITALFDWFPSKAHREVYTIPTKVIPLVDSCIRSKTVPIFDKINNIEQKVAEIETHTILIPVSFNPKNQNKSTDLVNTVPQQTGTKTIN